MVSKTRGKEIIFVHYFDFPGVKLYESRKILNAFQLRILMRAIKIETHLEYNK